MATLHCVVPWKICEFFSLKSSSISGLRIWKKVNMNFNTMSNIEQLKVKNNFVYKSRYCTNQKLKFVRPWSRFWCQQKQERLKDIWNEKESFMKLISQTFIDYQTKFYNNDGLENFKKVFAKKLVEYINLT